MASSIRVQRLGAVITNMACCISMAAMYCLPPHGAKTQSRCSDQTTMDVAPMDLGMATSFTFQTAAMPSSTQLISRMRVGPTEERGYSSSCGPLMALSWASSWGKRSIMLILRSERLVGKHHNFLTDIEALRALHPFRLTLFALNWLLSPQSCHQSHRSLRPKPVRGTHSYRTCTPPRRRRPHHWMVSVYERLGGWR